MLLTRPFGLKIMATVILLGRLLILVVAVEAVAVLLEEGVQPTDICPLMLLAVFLVMTVAQGQTPRSLDLTCASNHSLIGIIIRQNLIKTKDLLYTVTLMASTLLLPLLASRRRFWNGELMSAPTTVMVMICMSPALVRHEDSIEMMLTCLRILVPLLGILALALDIATTTGLDTLTTLPLLVATRSTRNSGVDAQTTCILRWMWTI